MTPSREQFKEFMAFVKKFLDDAEEIIKRDLEEFLKGQQNKLL